VLNQAILATHRGVRVALPSGVGAPPLAQAGMAAQKRKPE